MTPRQNAASACPRWQGRQLQRGRSGLLDGVRSRSTTFEQHHLTAGASARKVRRCTRMTTATLCLSRARLLPSFSEYFQVSHLLPFLSRSHLPTGTPRFSCFVKSSSSCIARPPFCHLGSLPTHQRHPRRGPAIVMLLAAALHCAVAACSD